MSLNPRIINQKEQLRLNPKIKYFEVINLDSEYKSRKDCTVRCLICGKIHTHYDISRLTWVDNPGVLACCKSKYTLATKLEECKKRYIDSGFTITTLDGVTVCVIDAVVSKNAAIIVHVKDINTDMISSTSLNNLKSGNFYFNKKNKTRIADIEDTSEYKWLQEHDWVLCGRKINKDSFKSIKQCEVTCEYCGKTRVLNLNSIYSNRNNEKYNKDYVYKCLECKNKDTIKDVKEKILGYSVTSLDGVKCEVIDYKKGVKGKSCSKCLVAEIGNNNNCRWVDCSVVKTRNFNLNVRRSVVIGGAITNLQGCSCEVIVNSRQCKKVTFLDGVVVSKAYGFVDSLKYPKIDKDGCGSYLGYKLQGFACGAKPIGEDNKNLYYKVYLNGKTSILRPCDLEEMYKNKHE